MLCARMHSSHALGILSHLLMLVCARYFRKKKAEVARDKEKRALDALEKGKSLMEGEGRIKEEVARLNDVVIKEVWSQLITLV